MKKNILIFLVLIAIKSFGQTKNFIDLPYLETTAKVDTLVIPDRVYLNIIVSEKDTKGKISVEELELKMIESLKSIGIDIEKQLSLKDLASNFKKYIFKQQDVIKTKNYLLLVYDAKTAGKVLVKLEEINISNVSLEKTECSKSEEIKLNLKTKAVSKAKKQAIALMKPLNQKLGNVIFISETNNFGIINSLSGKVSGIQIRGYMSYDKESKNEETEIELEKIKIETEINVAFKIE